jgi:hypothetical protein
MINGLAYVLLITCGFSLGLTLHFILVEKSKKEIDEISDTVETILFTEPELSHDGKRVYDHDLEICPNRNAKQIATEYLRSVL